VGSIVGVARRVPRLSFPKTTWIRADVSTDALTPIVVGADAVVHLAWLIQPARDPGRLRRVNIAGSGRVLDATAAAGVPTLVYASSVGTYAAGPKDPPVDERWPSTGIATSLYSTQKAEVERLLEEFERDHPEVRCVRLRPGLVFGANAASGIRRLFAGPLLPTSLLSGRWLRRIPDIPWLRVQGVLRTGHTEAARGPAVGSRAGEVQWTIVSFAKLTTCLLPSHPPLPSPSACVPPCSD
jgi:UDP-glucose 4-epimerase